MPRHLEALVRAAILGAAAVSALTGCAHVADALTNTGAALRRHTDQGSAPQATGGTATQSQSGATKAQMDAFSAAYKKVTEDCKASVATPELDPIRHKVQLWREPGEDPVPFEIATNDNFPTAEDRPVIAKWASLRDECIRRYDELPAVPEGVNDTQATMVRTIRSFTQQAAGEITQLMICLYQQKLTYAEFGRKLYEIGKSMGVFTTVLQQTTSGGANLQDVQAAQQQLTDTMDAFSKYVQKVSARKPKTVRVSGTGS